MMDQRSWTPRRMDVLRCIYRYQQEHGRAPTLREIGARTEIKSISNVKLHVDALTHLGAVTFLQDHARTLQLTALGEAKLALPNAPKGRAAKLFREISEALKRSRPDLTAGLNHVAKAPIWDDRVAARLIAAHLDELGLTLDDNFSDDPDAHDHDSERADLILSHLLAALRGEV